MSIEGLKVKRKVEVVADQVEKTAREVVGVEQMENEGGGTVRTGEGGVIGRVKDAVEAVKEATLFRSTPP